MHSIVTNRLRGLATITLSSNSLKGWLNHKGRGIEGWLDPVALASLNG